MNIKIRAYDTRGEGEMIIIDDLYWFEEHYVHDFGDPDFIFMLSTGLQDKNGKEIFDGDIMNYVGRKNGLKQTIVVKWHESSNYHGYKFGKSENYEIVGNIHQNPELLS